MPDDPVKLELAKYRQEWWKIAVSTLTPIVLAALTYFITNALNQQQSFLRKGEQILSEKQKTYVRLGERINIIYVYIADVGDFRNFSPPEVIQHKREADRLFHMYRPFWSCDTISKYDSFMNSAFETYSGGTGGNARIISTTGEKKAAYAIESKNWDTKWDEAFTNYKDPNAEKSYYSFVESILADIVGNAINTESCD